MIHCNTIVAIPTHKHKCDTMQHNSRLEPAHKHVCVIHCNAIVAIPTHKHKCDTMQHNSRLEQANKHVCDNW